MAESSLFLSLKRDFLVRLTNENQGGLNLPDSDCANVDRNVFSSETSVVTLLNLVVIKGDVVVVSGVDCLIGLTNCAFGLLG